MVWYLNSKVRHLKEYYSTNLVHVENNGIAMVPIKKPIVLPSAKQQTKTKQKHSTLL